MGHFAMHRSGTVPAGILHFAIVLFCSSGLAAPPFPPPDPVIRKAPTWHTPQVSDVKAQVVVLLQSGAADSRRRYMYGAFARGTGFLEFYIAPRKFSAHDWDVLAESLLWTQMTGAAFKNSRMHGGDPANTHEAYGFTGWTRDGGYVSIHNAAQKPYEFKLDRKFGVVPNSGPFFVNSPFEGDLKGLNKQYAYGDEVSVPAGNQVRILNFSVKPLDWSAIRALQTREKEHTKFKSSGHGAGAGK